MLNALDAPNILVVDDTPENLEILAEMLEAEGYRTRTVSSGRAALQAAISDAPDLVLLDIQMPEMNGFEVCKRFKVLDSLTKIPVIFISALSETLDKVRAFSVGGVDYITKPFQFEEVRARVESHLKLRHLQRELERHNQNLQELVQEQVKDIVSSHMATLFALSKLAESRDDDTGNHVRRVQAYCKLLATHLLHQGEFGSTIDSTYNDNLFHTAPLHDIGKVGIADEILLKPGRLTAEEFAIMKTHTLIGANTLTEVIRAYPQNTFVRMGVRIARWHHERWDGSGYPDGLSGNAIPLSSRILTIADQYDALRTARPYKPPFSHNQTCEILLEGDGRTRPEHFDPRILKAFSTCRQDFEEVFHRFCDNGVAA